VRLTKIETDKTEDHIKTLMKPRKKRWTGRLLKVPLVYASDKKRKNVTVIASSAAAYI